MARMDTLTCAAGDEDDANVALFHPRSGSGVVYGTKQGQIACALSTASCRYLFALLSPSSLREKHMCSSATKQQLFSAVFPTRNFSLSGGG